MSWKNQVKVLGRKMLKKSPWSGNYPGWQSASKQCPGYDAANILQKVKQATLKVKNGEAVYERDSVLFDHIEYSWPMVSALLYVAAKNNNSLKVMDFGGSLGSSYFQNRVYLEAIDKVEWNVIEQKDFVVEGQKHIASNNLQFFYTPEEYISQKGKADLLILSSVLPYLEKPYEILQSLLSLQISYLFIDLNFFNYEETDRLTIQNVPPEIYDAAYPCWFLSYTKLKELVSREYEIISEHNNEGVIYLDGHAVPYQGLLAKRK